MAVNVPTIKGISTIVWGTETQLGSPSGAIVESIACTPKNPTGLGEIENGNGAGVIDVLLDDGFDAKVTCTYDSAKDWPDTGGSVTLTLPKQHGSGTDTYTCYVLGDPEINTAKKQAATIALNLRYRPGIAP
ncbi:MAG TPA: hypothetical protein PKI20_05885 [Verrucomicrobiota bacterium]|nr:hypothetical protein [Verrucomicrobiota bacterium]HQL77164.1 hypothetical protein [Verrucomicrobiota bacterium]